MPLTPYHLGPNGFIALLFRKWLDAPVFVVAGLAVDLEVLFIEKIRAGEYVPRYGHTLLVAGAIGIGLAVVMAPLKRPCQWIMRRVGLPYETGLVKMAVSGVLGAWLHVVIDGMYRTGVGIFWPLEIEKPSASRFSWPR